MTVKRRIGEMVILRMRLSTNCRRVPFATLLTGSLLFLVACETRDPVESRLLFTSLSTDSAVIGVRFSPPGYFAEIGFVYVNTTAGPVSISGCHGPPDPELEKRVDGRWVRAYHQIHLLCLTKPDFRVESGATHRDVISFVAFQPGQNKAPVLLVDSIDGTYRLRWNLVEGTDASEGGRKVEAISNEFRMVLR